MSRKKNIDTHSRNSGFTLVELMLAMSFLAMLLLMISLLVLQVSMIYNKGLTLKAVNESGQLISSEIQRRLSTAPRETVDHFEKKSQDGSKEQGGRICADNVVYAWNITGASASDAPNRYTGSDSETPIRFIKFTGSREEYCVVDQGQTAPSGEINRDEVTELINPETEGLVIRSFTFNAIGGSEGTNINGDRSQALYRVAFTIGTDTIDLIDSNSNTCRPPAEAKQEFCAVNEFSFIARSTSGGEK